MRSCDQCGGQIPATIKIDGKRKNLCNRKFCLLCSPWGKHNTRPYLIKDAFCKKHGYCSFAINKKGRRRCRRCSSESVTKRRQNIKQKLVDIFGGKCKICGYNKCVQALEFHHLDPTQKRYEIGRGHCRKWEEILNEAKKCILVCVNCHAKIENNIINLADSCYMGGD